MLVSLNRSSKFSIHLGQLNQQLEASAATLETINDTQKALNDVRLLCFFFFFFFWRTSSQNYF